ncbi:MAG: acyltransferase, partial [Gammaproteobacteria bacterium]|nr:acyltransferase [Gammaproteobacteria bacterium]
MEESKNIVKGTDPGKTGDYYLPALTGIRFFAIFHIFLFHLVSMYWTAASEGIENLPIDFNQAPHTLVVFASNGWISTSLFFLLSGFILAYLYWGEDGRLNITRRRFWLLRAARIYPIHLIVMIFILLMRTPGYLDQDIPLSTLVPSALATIALIQAWVPAWIPLWSWPTWTISALVFLYLIMPWLMTTLSRLSHRQMVMALIAMPFVSIIPTLVYAARQAAGAPWSMNVDMFVANTPVFWVPYFAAGMLMTRVFSMSRFKPTRRNPSWFAWGDVAFIVIIAIACTPGIGQPLKFLIRQGLLMPFFVIMVLDLARGKGLMARFFSLPGTGFLGETGYSIFIWQSMVLLVALVSLTAMPAIGPYQLWIAMAAIMAVAIPSTYLIEKPIARFIRRKYIDRQAT